MPAGEKGAVIYQCRRVLDEIASVEPGNVDGEEGEGE
jgi:hypothetical protein